MPNRRYLSVAAKRKKKAELESQNKKLKGTLNKFILTSERSTPKPGGILEESAGSNNENCSDLAFPHE